MGLKTAVLIACAGLLLFPGASALAAKVFCLNCHRPHYEGKGRCVSCHGGDDRSDRLNISHHDLIRAKFASFTIPGSAPVERGKKLLESFACRRCHKTAGKGNRLASNLDRLPEGTTPQNIFDSIKAPALFMPDFGLDERQLTDLVNAILAGAKQVGRKGVETPQVVHFEDEKRNRENVFEKHCGSCHRVLSRTFGGLGEGNIGPNLSGLFSEQYPVTLNDSRRWTADILKKWLKNPRTIRKNSQMQPIRLENDEFDRLLAIFEVTP